MRELSRRHSGVASERSREMTLIAESERCSDFAHASISAAQNHLCPLDSRAQQEFHGTLASADAEQPRKMKATHARRVGEILKADRIAEVRLYICERLSQCPVAETAAMWRHRSETAGPALERRLTTNFEIRQIVNHGQCSPGFTYMLTRGCMRRYHAKVSVAFTRTAHAECAGGIYAR